MSNLTSARAPVTDAMLFKQDLRRMQEKLNKTYHKNMDTFRKYLPDIAERFANYSPVRSFQFVPMPDGQVNLLFNDINSFFYPTDSPGKWAEALIRSQLHHTHNKKASKYHNAPNLEGEIHLRYISECLKVAENYTCLHMPTSSEPLPCCLLLGIGLGYPAEEFLKTCEITHLQILEPDTDLFYASLFTFDWCSLLETYSQPERSLLIITDSDDEAIIATISNYFHKQGLFLHEVLICLMLYKSADLSAKAQLILKTLDHWRNLPGFFDDAMFGMADGFHAVEKSRHFVKQDAVLPDSFAKAPLFIIGNGPSLDHDLNFLRAHQHQAVIIACGSALETLFQSGIKSDFFACIERISYSADPLKLIDNPDYLHGITLIGTEVVHPLSLSYFDNHALFLKGNECFAGFARAILPDSASCRSVIHVNPLVGNMALSAAVALGFHQIYLFGTDCSSSADTGTLHSSASEYYQDSVNEISVLYEDLSQQIPGNFRQKVLTNGLYHMSIDNMTATLASAPPGTVCFNCSDGAFIEGTAPVHSSDLDFSDLPALDKDALRNCIEDQMTIPLTDSEGRLRKALQPELMKKVCHTVMSLFTPFPDTRVAAVKAIDKAFQSILQMCQSPQSIHIQQMLYGELTYFGIFLLQALYHSEHEEECLKDAELMAQQLKFLLEDAARLYPRLPEYIEGEHLRITGGKVGFNHPGFPATIQDPLSATFKFISTSESKASG